MMRTMMLALAASVEGYPRIAGYSPATDVSGYVVLDLDMKIITDALENNNPSDYGTAYNVYVNGGGSVYIDGKVRKLSAFSREATKRFRDCSNARCPYPIFLEYANFFGVDTYGDEFVMGALGTPNNGFKATSPGFPKHNMDFSAASREARFELIEKGILHLNVFMYVIRMLEASVAQCKTDCIACNDNAARSWDGAIAFYTGSLEGEGGDTEKGLFLHALADKRCHNFNTCGPVGGKSEGASQVNHKFFRLAQRGQSDLLMGNCADATAVISQMVSQMMIPMIQGTLRYAQINARTGPDALSDPAKARAEATGFAAALVPRIAACPGGADDAEFLWNQLKFGSTSFDYPEIKGRVERYYGCLNVTCAEVGGFFDHRNSMPYADSEVCTDGLRLNTLELGLLIGGLVLLALCVLACLCACYLIRREKKGKPVFYSINKGVQA